MNPEEGPDAPAPTLNNPHFERAVLGAALRDPESLEAVAQKLHPDDFTHPDNRALFTMLTTEEERGGRIDLPLLGRALARNNVVRDPQMLLASLYAEACVPSLIDRYISDLRSCSDARTLVDLGRALVEEAQSTEGDSEAVAAAIQKADASLRDMTDKVVSAPWTKVSAFASVVGEGGDSEPVAFTGFPDLDRQLQGGLRGGQLVTIAARPAQGKSTIAMDIARASSIRKRIPGLFISLEMSGRELAMRLMSAEGSVALTNIRKHEVTEDDAAVLDGVLERVEDAPLYIIDRIEPTLPAIRGAIVSAHRRLGIRWVVLDYLQLVTSDGTNNPSREQVVANVSRALKSLGALLDIVVIMVAQLNRGPEQRTDKRPAVSDLRESGQIEQDSDVIMLIFQPQTYDPATPRVGEADVIVGKQRNGPNGTVALAFQGHYARFASLATDDFSSPES